MAGSDRFLDRSRTLGELVRDLRQVERARPVTTEVAAPPTSHLSHQHDHGTPLRTVGGG